jgi:hypothetical protein
VSDESLRDAAPTPKNRVKARSQALNVHLLRDIGQYHNTTVHYGERLEDKTMEAYPPQYTAHPFPLVVLSGFALESDESTTPSAGPLITSNLPLVTSARKDELLQDFLKHEGNDEDWSGKHMRGQNVIVGYKFKTVGRVCTLATTSNANTADIRPGV